MFGSLKKWTARGVFSYLRKDEISGLVKADSGVLPQSPLYLSEFQKQATKMVTSLTDSEHAEYEEMAERWNQDGTPMEMRQQWVALTRYYHRCRATELSTDERPPMDPST